MKAYQTKQDLALYLDFYGALLTEHTRKVLELYINEDLSLGEIATLLDISRQAVYDRFDKGKQQLLQFETKLCLCKQEQLQKKNLALRRKILSQVQTHCACLKAYFPYAEGRDEQQEKRESIKPVPCCATPEQVQPKQICSLPKEKQIKIFSLFCQMEEDLAKLAKLQEEESAELLNKVEADLRCN